MRREGHVRVRAAQIGVAAAALLFAWQLLTVHYNYGGNWTALFMIGPRTPVPASISGEHLYIFQNTSGYDGQSFHIMAHDPWIRHNTAAEVEIAPFRYVRILVPALAWMIALGRDRWIDPAYFVVILAFGFLGTYWVALYAARALQSPMWGLAFLLSPATLTSVDRMLVDIALAALCAAFVLYCDDWPRTGRFPWKVTLVLACALLTRETAWLLFAAYEAFLFMRHDWRDILFTATAAIPAIAWQGYVAVRTGDATVPVQALGWIPFAGFVERIVHPVHYPLTPGANAIAIGGDYAALAGIALAIALAVRVECVERWTAPSGAIIAFALAIVFLRGQGAWADAYAFGRIFAPILLLIAMEHIREVGPLWLGVAPMLLVDSRIVLNFGKQAVGVLHGLLRVMKLGAP